MTDANWFEEEKLDLMLKSMDYIATLDVKAPEGASQDDVDTVFPYLLLSAFCGIVGAYAATAFGREEGKAWLDEVFIEQIFDAIDMMADHQESKRPKLEVVK